jgi:hypothetical protein
LKTDPKGNNQVRRLPISGDTRRVVDMFRFLIRVALLGLAAYGAKALYDRYGDRLRSMEQPAREFAQRTSEIASDTAGRAREAARQGMGAMSDATDELTRAATDTKDEASRRMADDASEDPARAL